MKKPNKLKKEVKRLKAELKEADITIAIMTQAANRNRGIEGTLSSVQSQNRLLTRMLEMVESINPKVMNEVRTSLL